MIQQIIPHFFVDDSTIPKDTCSLFSLFNKNLQGNYVEALECMERALRLQQHIYGDNDEQVQKTCRDTVDLCNLMAIKNLQGDIAPSVLELLQKAQLLAKNYGVGRAVTFNNMACYYRRAGKLRTALKYALKALEIERKLKQGNSNVEFYPADTYLNACAILSELGDHRSALEHAQLALLSLQEELFKGIVNGRSSGEAINNKEFNRIESMGEGISTNSNVQQQLLVKLDRIAVLVIAYHNLGVEQEFLQRYDSSVSSYKKGLEISKQYLGENNPTTEMLRKALNEVEISSERRTNLT